MARPAEFNYRFNVYPPFFNGNGWFVLNSWITLVGIDSIMEYKFRTINYEKLKTH